MRLSSQFKLTELDIQLSKLQVQDVKYPPSIRIMETGHEEPTEYMFKVQGIICDKVLPPVLTKP